MRSLGFILLFAAGCFPGIGEGRVACGSNDSCPPGYVCRSDRHCYTPGYPFNEHGDLSGQVNDLAGTISRDLTGTAGDDLSNLSSMDMALPTAGCGPSVARVCSDATHSAVCMLQGGQWLAFPDRACPPGSSCVSGYCNPPPATAGMGCNKNTDCLMSGYVCDIYVNTGTPTGHCTMAIPGAIGNNRCTTVGYEPKCNTGICAQASTGNPGCLERCMMSGDCPQGKPCLAVKMPATIEGVDITSLQFCQVQ